MSNWPRNIKVTITLEDNPDGTVEITVDPKPKMGRPINSNAYRLAMYAYTRAVQKALKDAEKSNK